MKRFLTGFVALMMALPLVGCGGETAPPASPPAETPDTDAPEGSGSTADPAEGEGGEETAPETE